MKKFRILLGPMPRLLGDLLEDCLGRQKDIQVKGRDCPPLDLLDKVGRTRANVVIAAMTEATEVPGFCSVLLDEYPDLLFVALSAGMDFGFALQRKVVADALADVSTASILRAIRAADPHCRKLT